MVMGTLPHPKIHRSRNTPYQALSPDRVYYCILTLQSLYHRRILVMGWWDWWGYKVIPPNISPNKRITATNTSATTNPRFVRDPVTTSINKTGMSISFNPIPFIYNDMSPRVLLVLGSIVPSFAAASRAAFETSWMRPPGPLLGCPGWPEFMAPGKPTWVCGGPNPLVGPCLKL